MKSDRWCEPATVFPPRQQLWRGSRQRERAEFLELITSRNRVVERTRWKRIFFEAKCDSIFSVDNRITLAAGSWWGSVENLTFEGLTA